MKIQETLNVEGMTCNHCVMRVQKALELVDGVENAKVDLISKSAVVVYDSAKTALDKMIAAVKNVGYQASR